jgi:hypothetical protein
MDRAIFMARPASAVFSIATAVRLTAGRRLNSRRLARRLCFTASARDFDILAGRWSVPNRFGFRCARQSLRCDRGRRRIRSAVRLWPIAGREGRLQSLKTQSKELYRSAEALGHPRTRAESKSKTAGKSARSTRTRDVLAAPRTADFATLLVLFVTGLNYWAHPAVWLISREGQPMRTSIPSGPQMPTS